MPSASISVQVQKDLMPAILDNVRQLGNAGGMQATVGIHADAPMHPMYGNGSPTPIYYTPTANLAKIQEFGDIDKGGNTPSRPFLRTAFDRNVAENAIRMKQVVVLALLRRDFEPAALKIATDQASATRLLIQSDPFKPLANRTKKNRLVRGGFHTLKIKWLRQSLGFTDFTPLIDSGMMQNSIEGRLDQVPF